MERTKQIDDCETVFNEVPAPQYTSPGWVDRPCPCCGSQVETKHFYRARRGYLIERVCTNARCDYRRIL